MFLREHEQVLATTLPFMEFSPCVVLGLVLIVLIGLVIRKANAVPAVEEKDDDIPDADLAPATDGIVNELDYSDGTDESDAPMHVRKPGPKERMVNLLRTHDRFEADLLRNILLENGIWCAETGDKNSIGLGEVGLSLVSLHIAEGDLFAARTLVDEVRREAHLGQVADERRQCPACGYDLRATPDRCPECGLNFTAATIDADD